MRSLTFIVRYIYRTVTIGILSLGFVLLFALLSIIGKRYKPWLLRWYFQAAGMGFVKLGQLLAMRYDLLPLEYCNELSKLLDDISPVPIESIYKIIEADFGQPWQAIYEFIEPDAIGSASIAQVHGAILIDGQPVVIKVMRPNSRMSFQVDFLNARLIGIAWETIGFLPSLNLKGLLEEFTYITRQELDFSYEVRNMQLLASKFTQEKVKHYVPKVYADYSTENVITMERLVGHWIKEILQLSDAERTDARMEAFFEGLATLIFRSLLTQIFHYRVFHADPHASNMIIMPGGVLGFVDFGLVGWLDEHIWEQQLYFYLAIAQGDVERAYRALISLLGSPRPKYAQRFEREAKLLLQEWIEASNSEETDIAKKSSGYFLLKIFDAVRHASLQIPIGTMQLNRAFIISDVIILKLAPHMRRLPVLKAVLVDEIQRFTLERLEKPLKLDPNAFGPVLYEYYNMAQDLYRYMSELPNIVDRARQRAYRRRQRNIVRIKQSIVLISLAIGGVLFYTLYVASTGTRSPAFVPIIFGSSMLIVTLLIVYRTLE